MRRAIDEAQLAFPMPSVTCGHFFTRDGAQFRCRHCDEVRSLTGAVVKAGSL